MTAEDRIADFLETERSANELIDGLKALREETEAYTGAGDRLDSARTALDQVAVKLEEIAGAVRDSVVKLNEIGMPALLTGQEKLAEQMVELQEKNKGLASRLASIDSQLANLAKKMGLAAGAVFLALAVVMILIVL